MWSKWCPFEKGIPGAVLRTRVFIPEPDPKKIAMIRKEALRPFVAGSGDLINLIDLPHHRNYKHCPSYMCYRIHRSLSLL